MQDIVPRRYLATYVLCTYAMLSYGSLTMSVDMCRILLSDCIYVKVTQGVSSVAAIYASYDTKYSVCCIIFFATFAIDFTWDGYDAMQNENGFTKVGHEDNEMRCFPVFSNGRLWEHKQCGHNDRRFTDVWLGQGKHVCWRKWEVLWYFVFEYCLRWSSLTKNKLSSIWNRMFYFRTHFIKYNFNIHFVFKYLTLYSFFFFRYENEIITGLVLIFPPHSWIHGIYRLTIKHSGKLLYYIKLT